MRNGKLNHILYLLLLPAILLHASSCNVTRSVPDGQHLLDKNIIKSDRTEFNENLNAIIKQKPNRKILGFFRFHLGVYNLSEKGNQNKTKKWLKSAVGEEPVILDTSLTNKSTKQIFTFFENNGFFNADVSDTTIYKKKKAKVIYRIKSGSPYKIRNVNYVISDPEIRSFILNDSNSLQLKPGKIYTSALLQNERERITTRLRNNGYYNFNTQYISYQIDSALKIQQVDIWLTLSNPRSVSRETNPSGDSLLTHKKNYYKEIYIDVDYDPLSLNDSIEKDTVEFGNLNFISFGKLELRYKAHHLAEQIFIKKDSIFSQADLDLTYKRISDLGLFKFINIRIEPALPDSITSSLPLRCFILLSPQARQEYKVELEGTNNGGNYGIVGNLVYKNKNIFKGGETFVFRIKAGLEVQQNFSDTTYESTRKFSIFNAHEIGPEISVNFPRGLWPFRLERLKRVNNPTTSVTAIYNQQNRPEFFRQLLNLSYSYGLKTTKNNRIFLYPIDLNFLKVNLDPAFKQQLLDLKDPILLLSYQDNFIAAARISYIFNNQDLKLKKNYIFFRTNLEFAGNALYLMKKINNESISQLRPSQVFNVRFSQYLRPDFDLRFYNPYANSNSLSVFRVGVGLGIAYGNSIQLPVEKSFFAGGPNDIRAWRTRSLGPGGSQKQENFERYGDLKIAGNYEYRFDLYRKLKGAAFIDAGNIWVLSNYSTDTEGKFNFSSFVDEIAIGAGLGIRFDFTFFILRLDGALKFKDPAQSPGDRWVYKSNQINDVTYNFGIGYPF